ncbi:MAG TPA: universal stress protein [Natronosporangium sp.]|nr:universal stress protein [Natronosporangium sp.]
MPNNDLIVVGVDGSDGGRRALQWAAQEAASRGGTVQAVTAWRWDVPGGGLEGAGEEDPRQRASDILEREVASVGKVPVACEVREGRPADVLVAAARDADLLVLGSRGHSRVWQAVLGSVTEECVRRATCPVVVIPVSQPAARPPTPVPR